MLYWNHFITLFVIMIVICVVPNGANSKEEKPIVIGLKITSRNERLKNEITSYIAREIRALGDVSISDDSNDYVVDIIAMESKLKNGNISGYTLAFIIMKPFNKEKIRYMLEAKHQSDSLTVFDGLSQSLGVSLSTVPTDGLALECQSFIADFDTKYLVAHRKNKEWDELAHDYEKKKETIRKIFEEMNMKGHDDPKNN